ncbi:hypothetical protein IID22_04875 [Patescibacteria group bacterium]|nr:hypothetical protein [Patescibacteria group bacterium]
MQGKSIGLVVLVVAGLYFLVFHTEPFPLNHNAIGLPPFHTVHAVFGVILLAAAGYLWRKK